MAGTVSEQQALLFNLWQSGAISREQYDLLNQSAANASATNTGAVAQGEQAAAGHSAAVQGNVGGNLTIIHNENVTAGTDSVSALRVCYLRRVLGECGELKLDAVDREAAGQGGKASLSLKAVYTALLTRTPRRIETERMATQSIAGQDEPPLSALEQLDRQKRLVLLGDPGSGKSTFVNFVALCLAGACLKDSEINLGFLTKPLPNDDGEDTDKPQPWSHDALLPLRVILRDFAARGIHPAGAKSKSPYCGHLSKRN